MAAREAAATATKPPAAYGTFSSDAEGCSHTSDDPPTQPRSRSALTRSASPLSRLFFLWFEYLVAIAKTRALRIDDVFTLDEEDRSAATYASFVAHMTHPRDFVWTMRRLYWRLIVKSGVLALVAAVGDALNPLLMYVVISAVASPHVSVWFVVAVLVARYVVRVVAQVARQHAACITSLIAKRAIGALHVMVFDATISSSSSWKDATVSEASNRFVELKPIHNMLDSMHVVWVTPLSLTVNLSLLVYILGDAVFGSAVVAVGVLFLAIVFNKVNKRFAEQVYEYRGSRLQIMSECFKAIQSIKLNAWEPRFLSKIRMQREKERTMFRAMAYVDTMWRCVLTVLPEAMLVGSLLVTDGVDGFSPAVVFASLSILGETKILVMRLVWLNNIVPMARVAAKQVLSFLEDSQPHRKEACSGIFKSSVVQPQETLASLNDQSSVHFQNATIGYGFHNPHMIMVNLAVPVGSLTIIHGNTGAGKSTLLQAMVDKSLLLNPTRGSIHVKGRVAYCSQDPWLQTLSIRDNILFGLPFDEDKYVNVLYACCLLRDLGALPHGDDTVIGPKGLTLSGGQKARIALARACYADADVYLLDCPLSSVDAIVQSDIFRRCLIELLKHKTVVLATHNEEVVSSPYVDQVVLVNDHRVMVEPVRCGGNGVGGRVRKSVVSTSTRSTRSNGSNWSNRCTLTMETNGLSGASRVVPSARVGNGLNVIETRSTSVARKWERVKAKRIPRWGESDQRKVCEVRKTLFADFVESATYYMKLCGGFATFVLPLVILSGLSGAALLASHVWISSWNQRSGALEHESDTSSEIEIFVGLIASSSLLALVASVVTLVHTSGAATKLFDRMARGVLMAPMSFFYSQPIGAVINRLTVDIRTIDEAMDFFVLESVFAVLRVVMSALVLAYTVPETLWAAPALAWVLVNGRYQWMVAMQIDEFELASNTPCFDAISEVTTGHRVIQAFGARQTLRFQHEYQRHVDSLLHMQHASTVMSSWRSLQFVAIDALILLALLVSLLLHRDSLAPLFGLVLHYAVRLNLGLQQVNYLSVEVASAALKIQNARAYGSITPEQSDTDHPRALATLPPNWPHAGEIVFDNVSFQYDDVSGPVLHNINLHIRPGEKIGLVGRTGSGKSSLTMALFRIHELVSGRILVDGVDIGLADLYGVRSRLSIIPQSPLFFQGTLRSYLDPFEEMDDVTLWEALRKTGLSSVVSRMEGKLVAELQENAENLSLGERQLLCLSRVLLKQSRVVVLDEATAAMDHASDELLQRVLQSAFVDATVVSIAHRLDSIMSFDRVVVMEEGRIVQCGSVEELVSDATGPFFDLLEGALLKM